MILLRSENFSRKLNMGQSFKIKKGLKINLIGEAEKVLTNSTSDSYAIKPTDFHGVNPKMMLKEGAEVLAGSPIFHEKTNADIQFTSPVSGEIAEIVRGAKRKILEIRIVADKEIKYKDFGSADASSLDADAVKAKMLESGVWPFITQRPYSIVANPSDSPRAIFISAFDSAPLAADNDFISHEKENELQAGIDALSKLTNGKVYLGVKDQAGSSPFSNLKGVEQVSFSGNHPAGNVGVQINKIAPINKGEKVWTVDPQNVSLIGRLFLTGKYDASRIVALAGSEVSKPKYYRTVLGAAVKSLVDGNTSEGHNRIISGNPLTGHDVGVDGYLGAFHSSVSVIPENDESRFLGWLTPNFDKFSMSRSFFSWLSPNKKYALNTCMNGEDRAFVVTGQYEKVFPFDIYPVQLLKAIMTKDLENMENLGIYEVAPEDFALCEFVCTSKLPLQQTVREGLDLMIEEVG